MSTGTYVGDGVDNRPITGVGFPPDVVYVRASANQRTVVKTSTMAGDSAKELGNNGALATDRIQSLDSDGFTVGKNAQVNQNGVTYTWWAFEVSPGDLAVGTYIGNGSDNRDITGVGFQPGYLLVMNATGEHSMHRFGANVGDQSFEIRSSGYKTDRIQDFLADGFQVGTHNTVNGNNEAIHWIAWRTGTGQAADGTYTGDGTDNRDITGLGFQPEAMFLHVKDKAPVERPESLTGDATFQIDANNPFANGIQSFLADGFQVGSDDRVNKSGSPVYWVSFTGAAFADLQVTKNVDDPNPDEGQTITYTVQVSNAGPQDATGVEVTDALPSGVTFVSASATHGTYSSGTGIWTVGNLPNGSSETLTITATVDAGTAGQLITNTATVTASDQQDPVPGNNSDSADITVTAVDVAVTKTVDDPAPLEGGTIVYTVVVDNAGPDVATGVEVTDVLPVGVTFVSAVATQGTYVSVTGVWAVGTVAVGSPDTLQITATVDSGTAGQLITNTATLTAVDQADTNPANDADSADITVASPGAPTLSSQDDQYLFVGDAPTPIIRFTVTDDPGTPTITAANDLRIRIPTGFPMTWDAADSIATVVGAAAPKVATAVTYEDADQTLVLDVLTDFAPGDQIIVLGLAFANFAVVAPFDHLELEVGNDGTVSALDDKTIAILDPVPTRSTAIAVTPDGQEVWVVNPDQASVSVIAAQGPAENTLLAEIPVGREPWTVAIHPRNGEAWVASLADDQVAIVDRASRTVVDTIALGFETFGVAFNPQGTVALVSSSGSDEVFAVNVATRTVFQTLPVHRRPRGIAWRGDGRRAWVSHLLMPEFFGWLTTVFPSTWTTAGINVRQIFATDLGGYPTVMQNIALAPAPGDSILWIPNSMLHTSNGQLFGNPLTFTNMVHATIRPVNVATSTDLRDQTYYLSESGTDVGGPIAVDFRDGKAYVANLNSDNVTVLSDDVLNASEVTVVPAGSAPIGVVTHRDIPRAYVANWLSRDVTVIDTAADTVVATVPRSGSEALPAQILNGKRLFFTSTGAMSLNERTACASCHVFGRMDGRPWDLSQFGKHVRATPDLRGIGFTGAHDWTADKDEMADHNFGILEFAGGAGLIPGGGNPPLGAPNNGLSRDMDDIGRFLATLVHRRDTPFLGPGGAQTAEADSGEVLFNDPTVGCAGCHVPPFFTDSRTEMPFIKHDVGTADSADADAAAGFDTPSLIGVWDTEPYLHHNLAESLLDVLTTYNPNDQHGTTSQLSAAQIDYLVAYLRSIRWPDSTGTPVDAPEIAAGSVGGTLERAFPNPFAADTSLRFSVDTPSPVRIDVFDVRGRLVRKLLDRRLPRGTHVVGWDSRDDAGRAVAPGVYFARYRVGGEERGGKKLVVLR